MTEVVVIGGGIAGAAAALELADRGAAVNVVDASRPGGAATGASAGMLAPQYETADAGPLFDVLVESRAAWPAFASRLASLAGMPVDLRRDGMLVANRTAEEHAGAVRMLAWQRARGQRGEIVDAARALAEHPGVAADVVSYLRLPDEAQVDAQQVGEALAPALTAAGVRVLAERPVREVATRGGAVEGVVLEDGRFLHADAVVVAAGAWSGRLRGLPRPLPVRPVRGHLLRYPAGSAALDCLLAAHAGRYLVPRRDGTILAGSTMDETGYDRSIDEAGLRTVHEAAARLLPALGGRRPVEWWAELRPIPADGLPIVGPDPEMAGLFYAAGYGRNGILLAPLAGRVVAELVLGGTAPAGWEAFSPGRL
jgi:glycine oxidase